MTTPEYYDKYDFTDNTGSREVDLEKYSISIEELEKEVTQKMENEFRSTFDRQSGYVGNGIYTVAGLYSSDTRQLFLMYCLLREDIKMADFAQKMATIRVRKLSPQSSTNDYDTMARLRGSYKYIK